MKLLLGERAHISCESVRSIRQRLGPAVETQRLSCVQKCRPCCGTVSLKKTYQEQLQQQHQQKQHAFEPRGLAWPGWSCWAGAVPPAADSCCTDICLFRISIRSDPMGCSQGRGRPMSVDVRNCV